MERFIYCWDIIGFVNFLSTKDTSHHRVKDIGKFYWVEYNLTNKITIKLL